VSGSDIRTLLWLAPLRMPEPKDNSQNIIASAALDLTFAFATREKWERERMSNPPHWHLQSA
jgi:hypothetical protein